MTTTYTRALRAETARFFADCAPVAPAPDYTVRTYYNDSTGVWGFDVINAAGGVIVGDSGYLTAVEAAAAGEDMIETAPADGEGA